MYDIIAALVLLVIMWMLVQSFIGKVHLNKVLKPAWQILVWTLLSTLKALIWVVDKFCKTVLKIELRRKTLPGRRD